MDTTAAQLPAGQQQLEAAARYLRALGDPTRLRILQLLLDGERSVSELAGQIGASASRISNHLACLRWCRFVESRRKGRRVIYRLVDPRLRELLALAGELSAEHCEYLASCTRIGPDWV